MDGRDYSFAIPCKRKEARAKEARAKRRKKEKERKKRKELVLNNKSTGL